MVAVIGDVHGCWFTLEKVVEKIRSNYPNIDIYCVGDLVDRGKHASEVFDYVLKNNIKFTSGNHEIMFYHFINKPDSIIGKSWYFNGYESTLLSYNGNIEKINHHLSIIKDAPLYFNLKDCFISHAGISETFKDDLIINSKFNESKLDEIVKNNVLESEGIIWTRNRLLNIGKLQIVGHTRKEEIEFDEEHNVLYIDTSAYADNLLSAVIIGNNKMIDSISIVTDIRDIA